MLTLFRWDRLGGLVRQKTELLEPLRADLDVVRVDGARRERRCGRRDRDRDECYVQLFAEASRLDGGGGDLRVSGVDAAADWAGGLYAAPDGGGDGVGRVAQRDPEAAETRLHSAHDGSGEDHGKLGRHTAVALGESSPVLASDSDSGPSHSPRITHRVPPTASGAQCYRDRVTGERGTSRSPANLALYAIFARRAM